MKYILEIGYMSFLLESNRGVATIMETLGRARQIEKTEFSRENGEIIGFSHGPPPVIECKTLRGSWHTKPHSATLEPDEVLPPVRGLLASGQASVVAGRRAGRLPPRSCKGAELLLLDGGAK